MRINVVDVVKATGEAAGGALRSVDVVRGLVDVAGERVHAVLELGEVFVQGVELFADFAGAAVGVVVFDQAVGAGEQGGECGRRGDPDARALRLFNDVAVAGVKLGKDGFAGQKEDGAFCGFRRVDVAVGDVVDVFVQVGAKAFLQGFVVRGVK